MEAVHDPRPTSPPAGQAITALVSLGGCEFFVTLDRNVVYDIRCGTESPEEWETFILEEFPDRIVELAAEFLP